MDDEVTAVSAAVEVRQWCTGRGRELRHAAHLEERDIQIRGFPLRLDPFSTRTMEYHFYFPETGTFAHFPVQVARNEEAVAHAEPFVFNVVKELSKIDKEAWPYLSQHGSDAQVLAYLENHNIERVNLEMIAFRMKDKGFFAKCLDLLRERHVYQPTLWSYGLFHDEVAAMREYLPHTKLANRCGRYFRSTLLDVDPVERRLYEHLEYSPLVNPRAHQVGKERTILNHRFRKQYQSAMHILGYKSALDDEDRIGVVYYLFLQDRVQEALDLLAKVDEKNVVEKMPLDYVKAYAAFYTGELEGKGLTVKRTEHKLGETQMVMLSARKGKTINAQVHANQQAGGKSRLVLRVQCARPYGLNAAWN